MLFRWWCVGWVGSKWFWLLPQTLFFVDQISACGCIETHTGLTHTHYPCGSNPRTCNNATTVSHNTLPAHSHKQPSNSFLHMLLWQTIFTAFGISRFGWNQKCHIYTYIYMVQLCINCTQVCSRFQRPELSVPKQGSLLFSERLEEALDALAHTACSGEHLLMG